MLYSETRRDAPFGTPIIGSSDGSFTVRDTDPQESSLYYRKKRNPYDNITEDEYITKEENDAMSFVGMMVYNIHYHIVWCVKYRRKVLSPQISTRLYGLLREIGTAKGFSVDLCKVGEDDHVHCFVTAPPKLSPTLIVKYLKGISGNTLLKEFPELRRSLWRGQLWNGSYFCETIGSVSAENVLKYIERQKNCQL